jgi:hypothetical protein
MQTFQAFELTKIVIGELKWPSNPLFDTCFSAIIGS